MNKIRRWFNKPKTEVGNQLMIQPCDSESTPQRLAALLSDLRDLNRGLISETRLDGSDPDLILTTRLNMLRGLLQGDISQEDEHHCPEPLRTTPACSPQTSAPLPVSSPLQVEQVTGNRMQTEPMDTGSCDITSLTPVGGGATNTSASFPELPIRSLLKTRNDCSLPSSPHPGVRMRLPSSLPCSPLLGGRRWRSSPSPPSGLSRLWVEAALQRSKQTEPRPPRPCSPQEGEDVRSRGGEREEDEGDPDLLCLDSEASRCPSAPPYEAEVFSAGGVRPVPSFSSEDQTDSERLTQLSDVQGSEGGSDQSLPRDRAPHVGQSSRLYPSLSLWRITADTQTEVNRKQEEEVNCFDSHLDHNTIRSSVHLQHPCEMISGVPGELQSFCSTDLSILKKVFESTTCSKRTARPVDSCSFCSDNLRVQTMKHLCRNCDQVFCSRCLSHFVSLLQIHQFSLPAAV